MDECCDLLPIIILYCLGGSLLSWYPEWLDTAVPYLQRKANTRRTSDGHRHNKVNTCSNQSDLPHLLNVFQEVCMSRQLLTQEEIMFSKVMVRQGAHVSDEKNCPSTQSPYSICKVCSVWLLGISDIRTCSEAARKRLKSTQQTGL